MLQKISSTPSLASPHSSCPPSPRINHLALRSHLLCCSARIPALPRLTCSPGLHRGAVPNPSPQNHHPLNAALCSTSCKPSVCIAATFLMALCPACRCSLNRETSFRLPLLHCAQLCPQLSNQFHALRSLRHHAADMPLLGSVCHIRPMLLPSPIVGPRLLRA